MGLIETNGINFRLIRPNAGQRISIGHVLRHWVRANEPEMGLIETNGINFRLIRPNAGQRIFQLVTCCAIG